jgi:hypothetical protein
MKLIIDAIIGDKFINDFMHSGDVFEQGKQLGKLETWELEGENILVFEVLKPFLKAYKEDKKHVIFLGLRSMDGKPVENFEHYFMKGVQTISNGHKFGLFRDLLKGLGYQVEVDENMRVTRVE